MDSDTSHSGISQVCSKPYLPASPAACMTQPTSHTREPTEPIPFPPGYQFFQYWG